MNKFVNAYIIYHSDAWQTVNLMNNSKLKSCLSDEANTVRNKNKGKLVYNVYRIAFDGEGLWNFGDGFARNILIFGVDNRSSYDADNRKKWFFCVRWRYNLWYSWKVWFAREKS